MCDNRELFEVIFAAAVKARASAVPISSRRMLRA